VTILSASTKWSAVDTKKAENTRESRVYHTGLSTAIDHETTAVDKYSLTRNQNEGKLHPRKMNMTYSTKEQAEREGALEAKKISRRGYPTTLLEVRKVRVVALYLDGQCPSEMTYVKIPSDRWEAVLS
jgi:hypothetical protein